MAGRSPPMARRAGLAEREFDPVENRIEIPQALEWLRPSTAGALWLERLPGLAAEAAERWSLRLDHPYPYAYASIAIPATRSDGSAAVLKIQFPDRESEHEGAALAHMKGNGAIRLIDQDPARRALLLERCVPGTPLTSLDADAALDVMAGLLPRTWRPAGPPFRPLAEEAGWWAADLESTWRAAGRPFDRRLLDAALEALRTLPSSQGEQVLVNQDLHAGNVLRAEREPWLVIDPKPLSGEREFGMASTVRDATGRDAVLRRLDRLTSELGLDRERARLWTMAQTVAWAFEGTFVLPDHIETAHWLLDAM
jgi:streptomycin 6-kinase